MSGVSPTSDERAGLPAVAEPTVFVESLSELELASSVWLEKKAIAVDTEFVRERTFYPQLGLIQIFDGDKIYLVDPVAIKDLTPVERVLCSPDVVKVFHSCGEDLEVLYHQTGQFPQPIFDTQIGAALCGIGPSLGYGALVRELFSLELEKGQTRTNWIRRPLTPEQIHYAAQDVAYLLAAYANLSEQLQALGRETWVVEETEQLFDAERFSPQPELFYLRIPQARSMSRRELAALKLLFAWREKEARRRDLPRNFVVGQATLPLIAKRRPRNLKELGSIQGLRPQELRRYGQVLLDLLRVAAALKPDELPPKLEQPLNLTSHKGKISRLRKAVADRAHEFGIAPELLASKKTVVSVVHRALTGEKPPLPEALRGWRREVVGDHLLELLARQSPETS